MNQRDFFKMALIKCIVLISAVYKTGMGTLGRMCGELGLRDAMQWTWDGDAERQIRGLRTRGR